jgi:hypothetical protein
VANQRGKESRSALRPQTPTQMIDSKMAERVGFEPCAIIENT